MIVSNFSVFVIFRWAQEIKCVKLPVRPIAHIRILFWSRESQNVKLWIHQLESDRFWKYFSGFGLKPPILQNKTFEIGKGTTVGRNWHAKLGLCWVWSLNCKKKWLLPNTASTGLKNLGWDCLLADTVTAGESWEPAGVGCTPREAMWVWKFVRAPK